MLHVVGEMLPLLPHRWFKLLIHSGLFFFFLMEFACPPFAKSKVSRIKDSKLGQIATIALSHWPIPWPGQVLGGKKQDVPTDVKTNHVLKIV